MIECPHCRKSIGGNASEGGFKIRLGILIVDPDSGDVHGPCPFCKGDVKVAEGADLVKALVVTDPPARPRRRVPGILIRRTDG